jgi:hypothetical protein
VGQRMRPVAREPNSRMRGPAGLNGVDASKRYRTDAEFGRLGRQEEEDGSRSPRDTGAEGIDTLINVLDNGV